MRKGGVGSWGVGPFSCGVFCLQSPAHAMNCTILPIGCCPAYSATVCRVASWFPTTLEHYDAP